MEEVDYQKAIQEHSDAIVNIHKQRMLDCLKGKYLIHAGKRAERVDEFNNNYYTKDYYYMNHDVDDKIAFIQEPITARGDLNYFLFTKERIEELKKDSGIEAIIDAGTIKIDDLSEDHEFIKEYMARVDNVSFHNFGGTMNAWQ